MLRTLEFFLSSTAPVLMSLLNKVASLQIATLIKKSLQYRRFPVKFAKSLQTPILKTPILIYLHETEQ